MTNVTLDSNNLIDELVRNYFGVEPDAMASLARADEAVRLRCLPLESPTTDPLDGLEVLLRCSVAAFLAMHERRGVASLVTERQAREAGWPTARLANIAITLGWALLIGEPAYALPALLAADEDAHDQVCGLIRLDEHLPTLEELLDARSRKRHGSPAERAMPLEASLSGTTVTRRPVASLDALLVGWFGIDATSVTLPSDRWAPRVTTAGARAAGVFAWLIDEVLELGWVMREERIEAVRLKTDRDARMAGAPGHQASNVVLLLAAASYHGSGTTVLFLSSRDDVAEVLVEAGRRIASRDGQPDLVDLLDLEDASRRGYVHVGRLAAKAVARRLYDEARLARSAECSLTAL